MKVQIHVGAHAETRPPSLEGKEKRKSRPDESWSIELDLPPCQDQSTKALQDVLDREPEDDREQDREVVKGVHDTKLPRKLSLQTAAAVRSTA